MEADVISTCCYPITVKIQEEKIVEGDDFECHLVTVEPR